MIKYFARATSLERRFLIAAALVVFLLFNYLFVWPKFSDWARVQTRDFEARKKLRTYEEKVAKRRAVEFEIASLERAGGNVPLEDQASDFIRMIQNQAIASGIQIIDSRPMPERTNQFFVERARSMTATTTDQPLVDFLYKLSESNSLVRVRGLSIRPDPPHHNLNVSMTLVGSYQKKARPVTPAAQKAAAPAAATKTAPPKEADKKTSPPVPPPGAPKTPTPPKK